MGVGGGTGHALEYTCSAIRSFEMKARMTICDMSIEAGARAGLIASDVHTFSYLADRPFAPNGKDLDETLQHPKSNNAYGAGSLLKPQPNSSLA